jgi:hypothetical protein
MMRRPLTKPTLVALCGLLAALALVAWAVDSAVAPGAGAPRSSDHAAATRTAHVSLSPAPDDLALAELSFPGAAGRRLSRRSLQVTVSGSFGDDYLALAAPLLATSGAPRALVLLVNRPSPLLDPVSVRLLIAAPRSLGAATVRSYADPLTRTAGARAPALCNLPLHGTALRASQLLTLHARGQSLSGFDAASAVAQAYDVVCELPHASSFEQAVQHSAPPSPTPVAPEPPTPTPTPTVPTPVPPIGKIPGEGCEPRPGYACPG